MPFGPIPLLTIAGSLGLLIHGMKAMSEGLQKVAGARMRHVLEAMTANRLMGVFTGFVTTVLIQLSSVTSVMAVSFVNAGVLSLRGAIGVLLGANLGTTVKAILFSAVGAAGSTMHTFALPLAGSALPLLLIKHRQAKAIGEFLMGCAVLFIGLELLRTALPVPEAARWDMLRELTGHGLWSVLLFVLIGILFTVVVQSSSVALAATMVLCEGGIIGYEMAAATVLGMNVGTTVTANIAALVGNAWARRTALAHFMIKAIGVIWALLLFGPFLRLIDAGMQQVHGASPFVDATALVWALTYVHISFNVINTLLLIGFVPQLDRLVTRMVPSRTEKDEQYRLKYIDDPVMGLSPELSLLEARREITQMGRTAAGMAGMVKRLLVTRKEAERADLMRKIASTEELTDRMEEEISRYLTRTSAEARDEEVSERIRAMLAMIGDLERVSDIFYQMSRLMERKHAERLWFTPEQRSNLQALIDLLDEAFTVMQRNLEAEDGAVAIDAAVAVEQRINHMRDTLRRGHLKSIEAGHYNVKSGLVYNDLFSSCEKVGDHLINVSEALVGKV